MMYYVQMDEDGYRLKYDDWISDDSLIYLLCIHRLHPRDTAIRGLVKSHMHLIGQYIFSTQEEPYNLLMAITMLWHRV